jgi:hypothetical protein
MEKKTKTKTFEQLCEEINNNLASTQPDVGGDSLESELDAELNGGDEGGEDEISFSLPRSVAQQFVDTLQAALGGGDEFGEEDGLEGEEGLGDDMGDELPQESADADEEDKEEITEEDEEGEDEEPVEEANECIDGQDGKLTKQKSVTKIDAKVGGSLGNAKGGTAKTTKNSGDKQKTVTKIDAKVKTSMPGPGKDFLKK